MRSRPARRRNLSILASWHPLSNSVLLAVMTNLGVGNAMGTAKAGSELRGSTPPTAPQQATAPQASQRERAMLMRTDRSRSTTSLRIIETFGTREPRELPRGPPSSFASANGKSFGSRGWG